MRQRQDRVPIAHQIPEQGCNAHRPSRRVSPAPSNWS